MAALNRRIDDGSLAFRFPEECLDGLGVYQCSRGKLRAALLAEIPDVEWPLDYDHVPETLAILDLLEFCHASVGEPIKEDYHEFFRHYHLDFDQEKGQASLRDDINRILARNGIAYELGVDGKVSRIGPPLLQESLHSAVFKTGDDDLDSLLETARGKFLNPDLAVRKESLEKLWDAWERLKTIEPGNKKQSTKALLDKAADEMHFRNTLETEAKELTNIGNEFRIRHSETDKAPVRGPEQVDYFFHRMFALIFLVLRKTGRLGE